jgi:plastocyanin
MPSRNVLSLCRILGTILLANIVAFVSAAEGATSTATKSSTASASSSTPTTHIVTVGNNGDNSYHPNVTFANPGDIVSFQFWPTNHSVVRGEYAGSESCGAGGCNPCVPYDLIHPGAPGMFYSKNFLTQTLPTVNNLEVWISCGY